MERSEGLLRRPQKTIKQGQKSAELHLLLIKSVFKKIYPVILCLYCKLVIVDSSAVKFQLYSGAEGYRKSKI